jgi:hypothetical protein
MRRWVFASTLLACAFTCTHRVVAQTWSLERVYPTLFEIIAVDAVGGDTLWPYAQEDLADDGTQTLEADEAAVDLRSVYADARAKRLWLRAYVASKLTPGANALAFFFIDTDARTNTGGKADDHQIWSGLGSDPTPGGYERALGLRGDGTLFGVFFWDAQKKQWSKQAESPKLAATETGVARDPLRISGDDHGYFQVDLELTAAGLTANCDGTIFVRLWNDGSDKRKFGDDSDVQAVACHARLDRFGDPEPLRSDACTADAECPAQGHCSDGVCLFGYECNIDSACRTGEKCSAATCVRAVDKACKQSADCAGLVCDAGRCVACASSATRTCADGWLCAPSGECRDTDASSQAGTGGTTGGAAASAGNGAKVRGGSFSCAAGQQPTSAQPWALLLGIAVCAALRGKRRPKARATCQGGDR